MLVLTRKVGETLVIEGGIRITVAAIPGGRVRLAIDAPSHVRVDREEVAKARAEFDSEPDAVIVGRAG
jgi:carbon storage regulator